MNSSSKLAIVIPAFKGQFLSTAIASISRQTCKNFTLYVGDDASPSDLESIVRGYEDVINITYNRFENNLGGKDLVSHWSRCISMVNFEEWIWLFSDDDIMEEDCVKKFYEFIEKKKDVDLLHFNIKIIDKEGSLIKTCPVFPAYLSIKDFFSKRINYEINSTVIEYIFKKSKYDEEEGFKNYDLAWCSDDATWMKFGRCQGIITIPGVHVRWRYSDVNISSIREDKEIILRKLNSNIAHINWVSYFFSKNNIIDTTTKITKIRWTISTVLLTSVLTFAEKVEHINKALKQLNYSSFKIKSFAFLYLLYWEIRQRFLGRLGLKQFKKV